MSLPFIHLRVHSSYSLAEGMLPIKPLIEKAAKMGQPALALTDSFNSYGALEFSEAALKSGIQPIIGAQVMIRDDTANEPSGEIVLLVQNEDGWMNLSVMMSRALLSGEHDPFIPLADLRQHAAGLIALTGGAKHGFVAAPLAENRADLAKRRLASLMTIFPNRLYVEIQRHHTERETAIEPQLLDMAYDNNIPIVATNDCYFGGKGDADAHNVLLCISESKTLFHDDRRHETDEHYFKSEREMKTLFSDLPEAIENTAHIARRCAFAVKKKKPLLPPFATPDGSDEKDWLRNLSHKGCENRLEQIRTNTGHAAYAAIDPATMTETYTAR